jgi:uncharacterized membrane protein YczE
VTNRSNHSARLIQLFLGLALYGISDGLLLAAGLGADPWDVFSQGLSRSFGLGIGTWTIIVGAIVLLIWIPLRQRPGLGTLANVVVIGLIVNEFLSLVPAVHGMAVRTVAMLAAVLLNGVATAMYIGANYGPGPRDGLMTGWTARGHSLRVGRTAIEATALLSGWFLGGTVGVGTLVYALSIGALVHWLLPRLSRGDNDRKDESSSSEVNP